MGAILIPVRGAGHAQVDADDAALVASRHWYAVRRSGGRLETIYAESAKHPQTMMHRLILGDAAKGLVVDHINGDGLDNRRANLRLCTQGENARNVSARPGTSKFKGVSRRDGKWRARIMVNRREISLGRFDSEVEAACAYDAAAVRHFGSFAKLNFGPAPEAKPVTRRAG